MKTATMKEVFDRIAPGWYNFRHWTIFRRELEALARRWGGGKLLNVGCAHGPDFLPFREGFELHGVDISPEMLKLAEKYAAKHGFTVKLAEADARQLPYPDATFDRALAVATYHHLPGKEAQLAALRELFRVMKLGGEAFVTVWNRWQPRFWLRGKEVSVPWRTGGQTLLRYYYLFSYGEMVKLARRAGFEIIPLPVDGYRGPAKYFSRNVCLLLRKPGGGA
ncbi:MAG: class I SAM-dependent methyltransferase [Chloroflexota bacterium]